MARPYRKRTIEEIKNIMADRSLGMSNVKLGKKYSRSTSTIRAIVLDNEDLIPREEIASSVKAIVLENIDDVGHNVDNIINKGFAFYSGMIDEITAPTNKAGRGELDVVMRIMQEAVRYQGKLIDNSLKLNIHQDNLGFKEKELETHSDNTEEMLELMNDIAKFGK